jgi:hypothetical protein
MARLRPVWQPHPRRGGNRDRAAIARSTRPTSIPQPIALDPTARLRRAQRRCACPSSTPDRALCLRPDGSRQRSSGLLGGMRKPDGKPALVIHGGLAPVVCPAGDAISTPNATVSSSSINVAADAARRTLATPSWPLRGEQDIRFAGPHRTASRPATNRTMAVVRGLLGRDFGLGLRSGISRLRQRSYLLQHHRRLRT